MPGETGVRHRHQLAALSPPLSYRFGTNNVSQAMRQFNGVFAIFLIIAAMGGVVALIGVAFIAAVPISIPLSLSTAANGDTTLGFAARATTPSRGCSLSSLQPWPWESSPGSARASEPLASTDRSYLARLKSPDGLSGSGGLRIQARRGAVGRVQGGSVAAVLARGNASEAVVQPLRYFLRSG